MSEKKSKNPKMQALQNKIFDLEKEIEEIRVQKELAVDPTELPRIAVALRFDDTKSLYYIDIIRYDSITGMARLQESHAAGDSQARARFELQKYLAANN